MPAQPSEQDRLPEPGASSGQGLSRCRWSDRVSIAVSVRDRQGLSRCRWSSGEFIASGQGLSGCWSLRLQNSDCSKEETHFTPSHAYPGVPAELTIRQYEPGDGERIRELDERTLREVNAYVDDPEVVREMHPEGKETFDEDLYDISGKYLDAGGEFLVGLLDGEIVAMGALERESDTRARLTRMRVQPGHQRQGFGQAILDALESRAVELGYEELLLDTTARQEAARAFYEANDYAEFTREQWGEFDVRIYRKSLGDG